MPNKVGQNKIGRTFGAELAAAGLGNLHVTWGSDGAIDFGPDVTEAQRAATLVVYANHDPDGAEALAGKKGAARAALDASDVTVLRCAENNVPVPQAWRDYRTSLRSVISAKNANAAPLPTRPAFPAGT